MVMEVRLEQLENGPMEPGKSGNESMSMKVTLLGIVIDVRLEQLENEPMEVTLLGIVMDVRLDQPKKSSLPIGIKWW